MTGPRRRERDAVEIRGDYQARALESEWAAQRFWHAAKIRLMDRVAPPAPEARVADAGCGSGVIADHLARSAGHVTGFDSNPAAVEHGVAAYPRSNLRFVLGPFERMRDHAPFDHIVCLEVLEHLYLEQAEATLRLFAEVAAPGATLFVTTPNARSLWPAIEWLLDRSGLVPTLDEAQHLTLFSAGALRACCERAGWEVEELGSFNGLAPFLAPVSESLACGVERAEFVARRWLPLNLLYCRARRPASAPAGTGGQREPAG
ncbi:MAG: class I SAM-dependent methyltransferase [Acidobacteriota bacterium]|nr:class I SAM-dependent methyltransferase [Acidobacteriota bacterium]